MAISQFKATTAELLASIKSRVFTPTSQETLTDEDLLQLADEELLTGLVPIVLSTQEDYYTYSKDYVATSKEYQIPSRAMGAKLRDVICVTPAGEEYSVPRINPEDVQYADDFSFYIRANKVIFTKTPKDTVRLYFHLRPNCLIKLTACGTIVDIDRDAKTIEVSNAPSNFVTGSTFDAISPTSPFKCKAIDFVPTDITGTILTVSEIPDVELGDYVCLAGQSPVVQLTYELIPVLAQRVADKVLEASGDRDGLAAAQASLNEMEKRAFALLEPRVDGQPRKIINYHSTLRSYNRYRRYF